MEEDDDDDDFFNIGATPEEIVQRFDEDGNSNVTESVCLNILSAQILLPIRPALRQPESIQ
jgi:hypothetical protein